MADALRTQRPQRALYALRNFRRQRLAFLSSDNFTSNEDSYLHVVDKLRQLGATGGAHIGVGPEQNFTYIAKIRLRIAFIVDIRRQAVIQHLMYKAIFHLAPDRIQFLSLLLSRPLQPTQKVKVPTAIWSPSSAPATGWGRLNNSTATGAHSDALQTAQEALEGPNFLSQQTGGFTVVNTNDLNIGIKEALYDQQSYYLLGFDPEDEKFDRRHHSIRVKVNRPGVRVRTRSGFFGVNDRERENESEPPKTPKTRGQQILAALLSRTGARDLSLRMTPYFFNSSKDLPASAKVIIPSPMRKRRRSIRHE